ncbi:MAG: hypothetical protein HY776_03980 [Actinobacteria bacterium]|nr:hypothetical protein [Actinomycetota bacterium]
MFRQFFKILQSEKGITFIETTIALVVLLVALTSLIPLYTFSIDTSKNNMSKTVASNLANQELEKIRNLSYEQVGTNPGSPSGSLNPDYDKVVNGVTFHVETRVNWIDGDFDGYFPADAFPNDYKRAKVTVTWQGVLPGRSVTTSTAVAREGEKDVTNGGNIQIIAKRANGNPIDNVQVDVTNAPMGSSPLRDWTAADGKALFAELTPSIEEDDYAVAVSKTGWISPVGLESKETTVVAGETRCIEFILETPGRLIVHLVDPQGVSVGKNSDLTVVSAETGTVDYDSHDGDFDIPNLFPGDFEITADAASFDPTSSPVEVELQPGETEEINITLQPTPSGVLHLRTFDQQTGDPLGSADVKITNVSSGEVINDQTNPAGILNTPLEVGDYTIEVSKADYIPSTSTTYIEASGATDVDVYLQREPIVGSIFVKVQNRARAPLESIRIRVRGVGITYDQEQSTNSSGEVLFNNLAPGRYNVYRFAWNSWRGWQLIFIQQVTVVAGQQSRVIYTLR